MEHAKQNLSINSKIELNPTDNVSGRSTNSYVLYPARKISLTNLPKRDPPEAGTSLDPVDASTSCSIKPSVETIISGVTEDSGNANAIDQNNEQTEQKDYLLIYPPIQFARTVKKCEHLQKEKTKLVLNVNSGVELASPSVWTNLCRICYGSDSFEELIGPCKCRGSVAYAHRTCLERWLKESSRSRCELCKYRYQIIRTPKYCIAKAILIWMFYPDDHSKDLLMDFFGFCLYTPTALLATYLLLISCESIRQVLLVRKSLLANLMAFIAISGMASIDFAYSSWLIFRIRKHMESWRRWWLNNCQVTLIIPPSEKDRNTNSTETIIR